MKVANIQRFCMHDGPGVRTTVFLKGCPLRCRWCHNPETQRVAPELLFYADKCIGCGGCMTCPRHAHSLAEAHILDRSACAACGVCAATCPTGALVLCGEEYTADALLAVVRKDEAFYGDTGGVTLSGGEPFAQAEEALSLLRRCQQQGIHTTVETCGYFSPDILPRAVAVTDLFLWDIKETAPARHEAYTGVSNRLILDNLFAADRLGAKTRLRCLLVSGVNTDPAHYRAVADIARRLHYCEGVEFLPYHVYGGSKSRALGREDAGDNGWIPTAEQLAAAKRAVSSADVTVIE